MNKQNYAKYWRNSLVDAQSGKGILDGEIEKHQIITIHESGIVEFTNGQMDRLFPNKVQKDEDSVDVEIRPFVYGSQNSHGQKSTTIPECVTPIVLRGKITPKDCKFQPDKIIIPRELLWPQERGGAFVIGELSELDKWTTENVQPERDADWNQWMEYCQNLLKDCLKIHLIKNLIKKNSALIKFESDFGSQQHIIKAYNCLLEKYPNESIPLFENYARETVIEPEECLPMNSKFSDRLGHSNHKHPLANAQRDALSHLLHSQNGEILGVNGPPGTGKTTLLLSVVASLWAKAALEGGNPPVIVAASANNQPVTNIIDAFGKDFSKGDEAGVPEDIKKFAGRWLPDNQKFKEPEKGGIRSYGGYFPAQSKEAEASEKYQTKAFYNEIESFDYYKAALKQFVDKAKNAINPNLTEAKAIVEEIQRLIKEEKQKLFQIEQCFNDFKSAKEAHLNELGLDSSAEIKSRKDAQGCYQKDLNAWEGFVNNWNSYCANESFLWVLFSWLNPIKKQRVIKACHFLSENGQVNLASHKWDSVESITSAIVYQKAEIEKKLIAANDKVKKSEEVIKYYDERKIALTNAIKPLNLLITEDITLDKCDQNADTTIRFKIFLLATHYWEGRWLMAMGELIEKAKKDNPSKSPEQILGNENGSEKKKNGKAAVEARWRRRMMITPCVVSTFYMLPKHMEVTTKNSSGGFETDYDFNFADWLIVDEAGQVTPEVAGASFALAKRALVIGDTLQIEPIWSITRSIDIGNLREADIIDQKLNCKEIEKKYERLNSLGKTSSQGSVMKIAQNASRYHYNKRLARGLFLYEHRRCFDEIIAYCNELCYGGCLAPKRGGCPQEDESGNPTFPPAIGYWHIDGECEELESGSRKNQLEAEAIADWIHSNTKLLNAKKEYEGKELHQIVAVVTPFKGQVNAIMKACEKVGILCGKDQNGMTVGTVHSLQGAERPIVIFSPTYSKDKNGGFIDDSPSMLNVAVSRAKDSFLVFGDIDIFGDKKEGPSGILAKHLERGCSLDLSYSTSAIPIVPSPALGASAKAAAEAAAP